MDDDGLAILERLERIEAMLAVLIGALAAEDEAEGPTHDLDGNLNPGRRNDDDEL